MGVDVRVSSHCYTAYCREPDNTHLSILGTPEQLRLVAELMINVMSLENAPTSSSPNRDGLSLRSILFKTLHNAEFWELPNVRGKPSIPYLTV